MHRGNLFVIASVVLFVICLVFLISFLSFRKISVKAQLKDEYATREILKRRDEIKFEIENFKEEIEELNKAKEELAVSLKKQKEINELIQKQLDDFKKSKENMESKYNKYIEELKQLKDKLDIKIE